MKLLTELFIVVVAIAGLAMLSIMIFYYVQTPRYDGFLPVWPWADQMEKKPDLIRVDTPQFKEAIKSPLAVRGQARGSWFFEGTFPVKLYDDEGGILVETYAQAQGEWMTEDFVAFRAMLEFEKPEDEKGVLVLEKDNPSGLPENDDELRTVVYFGEAGDIKGVNNFEECLRAGDPIMESHPRQCRTSEGRTFTEEPEAGACVISGCSGEVCGEEAMVTTCQWLPEFECYRSAVCERHYDGTCGWTMSDSLLNCLAKKGPMRDLEAQ